LYLQHHIAGIGTQRLLGKNVPIRLGGQQQSRWRHFFGQSETMTCATISCTGFGSDFRVNSGTKSLSQKTNRDSIHDSIR